jgi:hypothetical protein
MHVPFGEPPIVQLVDQGRWLIAPMEMLYEFNPRGEVRFYLILKKKFIPFLSARIHLPFDSRTGSPLSTQPLRPHAHLDGQRPIRCQGAGGLASLSGDEAEGAVFGKKFLVLKKFFR